MLRFVLPLLAADDPRVVQLFGGTWWRPFFEVNILQLAGLSLMTLGPVKRYVHHPVVAALAFAVAAAAPLLWGLGGSAPLLDPLWATDAWVSFPLFPWLAYPLLGLALAEFAGRATSADRLMCTWALAGACAVLAGAAVLVLVPGAGGILVPGDYFRSGLSVQLLLAGFVLMWLPALWWTDRHTPLRAVKRYLTSLSRSITAVYVIQWLLIGWTGIALGLNDVGSWMAALAAIPILVASHLLALGYKRVRSDSRGRGRASAALSGHGQSGCAATCPATPNRGFSERRPCGRTRSSLRDRLDDLGRQIVAEGRFCGREQPQLDLPLRIAVAGRPCGVHDFNDAVIGSDRPVHGR